MTNRAQIAVIAGPSLPPPLRPHDRRLFWFPPARSGDIAALADRGFAALCLIDGRFDDCAAPWHKEILMLMARGVAVYGAASIGALRAAELDTLGMTGVGNIYEAYRSGRLTGDDEVALVHAPETLGWVPLTVPLVEIRATLWQACREDLLEPAVACALFDRAAGIHFADRDWETLTAAAVGDGLIDVAAMDRLRAMHVPLKRIDARLCVTRALTATALPIRWPPPPQTCFIDTMLAGRSVGASPRAAASTNAKKRRPVSPPIG